MSDSRTIKFDISDLWIAAWITLWIFVIGFAKLTYYQGAFAIVTWPYYLGDALASLAGR